MHCFPSFCSSLCISFLRIFKRVDLKFLSSSSKVFAFSRTVFIYFFCGWIIIFLLSSCFVIFSLKTGSDQIRSVAQSCPTLCNPMNRSTPGLPVHHQLLEFTETHVHRVSDAIQLSHPLSSPSPLSPNPSQHQSLFQWVNSSHEVAKVLEFQL